MKKSTIFWMSSAFLLIGVIIGFLISPVKKGMYNGNHVRIDRLINSAESDESCESGVE